MMEGGACETRLDGFALIQSSGALQTDYEWGLGSLVASSLLPTVLTGIHIRVSPTGSMSSLNSIGSIGSQEMVMVDSTKEVRINLNVIYQGEGVSGK